MTFPTPAHPSVTIADAGINGESDVTFRWFSNTAVVVDLHLFAFAGSAGFGGTRLLHAGTGVYSATLRLPDDAGVSYGFVVSSDENATAVAEWAVADNLQHDPHNPDVIHQAFGMAGSVSVLGMPRARRHPAWVAQGASGLLERAEQVTAAGRQLTILAGPVAGAATTLLVVFDGDLWARPDFGFDAALAQWTADRGASSDLTTVLVSTADRAMLADRALMAKLLLDDVLPALEHHFPNGWASLLVAGQSYGALAAAGLLVDLPHLVDGAILQSGSFWRDEASNDHHPQQYTEPGTLSRLLLSGGHLEAPSAERPGPRRIIVQAGSSEGDMLDQSRVFASAAAGAGFSVEFEVFSGGHDYAWYRHGLLFALDQLL